MVSTDFIAIGEGDPGVAGTWNASGTIDDHGGATERFGVTAATADVAIQAAHDALPSSGGAIRCYGGTSPWTISAQVNITKPRVTIEFNQTEMRPGAALAQAFNITARGFRARQPYVNSSTISAADHAFFLFADSGTEYATNEGQVTDGLFIIGPTTSAQQINAIRVEGEDASNLTRGFSFRHNCFVGHATSTEQATPEDGSGYPYGFCPIHLLNVSSSDISYNAFYGACTNGINPVVNQLGTAIFLEDCILVPIVGNKFSDYTTLATDGERGWVIQTLATNNESGHNAIVANVEETAISEYRLDLKSGNHQVVVGNNFGRNAAGKGTIQATNGQDLLIASNNLHNTGGTAPIVADGAKLVNVKSNTFSLLATGVPPYTTLNSAEVDFDSESNYVSHQIQ